MELHTDGKTFKAVWMVLVLSVDVWVYGIIILAEKIVEMSDVSREIDKLYLKLDFLSVLNYAIVIVSQLV